MSKATIGSSFSHARWRPTITQGNVSSAEIGTFTYSTGVATMLPAKRPPIRVTSEKPP
jgi:hypothetical protein